MIRLVVFNHSYFGFKKGSGTMDARVELLSPDFVRLRLRRPPHFHWSPGQAAYLIMPGVSTIPFEAHPFTISSVDASDEETRERITPTTEKKEALAETGPYWKELVFFINVHGGFTRKLRDVAEKGGKAKVFVDGPYGKSPDLSEYDTSVLIAGGSGVTFTLPLFLDGVKYVHTSRTFRSHLTNRTIETLLLAGATPSELLSSGRSEIEVRVSCVSSKCPSSVLQIKSLGSRKHLGPLLG